MSKKYLFCLSLAMCAAAVVGCGNSEDNGENNGENNGDKIVWSFNVPHEPPVGR
jgi:hypothetical protein